MVYSTDHFKAVVSVLILLFVALWFILRGDVFYVLPCVILFSFFSPFSIPITSLGEERANFSVFRTFDRRACLDLSVSSSSWCLERAAVCDALVYLLDNIYTRFGTKLYRQTIGIPMGTNCAPLVADLFLFCYERDFIKSLSRENQADIIEAFNSTSRYLDDLLNINNIYFDQMVDRIYPTELQLNIEQILPIPRHRFWI